MSNVELVIKLPEEVKNRLCFGVTYPKDIQVMCEALNNGTSLPKKHGRLIDVDDIRVIELEDSLHIMRHEKGDEIDVYIDAPTIVEADKESEV